MDARPRVDRTQSRSQRTARRRTGIDLLLRMAGRLCAAIALLVLSGLLLFIAVKGGAALSIEFLTERMRAFGAGGGIAEQIAGSLLLVLVAAVLSFPLALGIALFMSEFLRRSVWQKLTGLLIYGLNAVPSIVFGLFGLIFFVHGLGMGISWFAGSIILAIMMLPTIVFAAYQAFAGIPQNYRHAALALGLDRWQLVVRVIVPQGLSGAITGLFLAMARAIGETAPIMFIATAFSGAGWPHSLFEPVATLPTHILSLAQQATEPRALVNAWGTSLVLLMLVLMFSSMALIARSRLQHKS